MIFFAYLAASVATAVSFGVLFWTRRAFDELSTAIRQPTEYRYDDRAILAALDTHADAIDAIREKVDAQTLAIAEGIQHVDRAERRVRAVVGRAKKRLDDAGFEDAGVEGELEQLRLIDGERSESDRVPSMRSGVANGQARDMSAFPGSW